MTSKPRVHGTRPPASGRDLGELIDPVDRSEVVRQVDEAGLRLVRFLWCGNDGTVRAKASARQGLQARMRSGIGVTVAMNAMNGLDQLQRGHRILPQHWAGAFTCWGHDNREAPLRLPSVFQGMEEASTNLELKAADASCNPYLALGGLIAAGLDGLERGLEPPAPVEVDPATIPEQERERTGIHRLPSTQRESLDALAGDAVLTDALGPVLAESYLAVRRSEWDAYSVEDAAFEQRGHFLRY